MRSVGRVRVRFALVTPSWSLFDPKPLTWVLQANAMTKPSWFQSVQLQALPPLPAILVIPFVDRGLFPAMKRGVRADGPAAQDAGYRVFGLSWVVVGAMQVLDGGHAFSIAWQVRLDALPTLGEVPVSATGLEFAYSQAPQAMQGVRLSFWRLSVTNGHVGVLGVHAGVQSNAVTGFIGSTGLGVTVFQRFFFAGFAVVAALVFGRCARRHRAVDHGRKAEGARRARASLTRGDGCPITHR